MDSEEHKLITEISTGNEKAFESLFLMYYSLLCVFAKKMVLDMDIAKEITQELFIHIWETRGNIQIRSSLKSYLFQSIRNRCLNYIKQTQQDEKRKSMILQNYTEKELGAILESIEFERQIFQLIDNLPPQCSKIFKMSRFEEMKYAEIANELGISVKTVETQITKALKILRNSFESTLHNYNRPEKIQKIPSVSRADNAIDEFISNFCLFQIHFFKLINTTI